MSEGKPIAFQGEGQAPEQPSEETQQPVTPETQEAENAVQTNYLTLEEAQKLIQEATRQAEEAAFRRAQGLVDKLDGRLTKRVQEDLKSLRDAIEFQRKLGMDISPEQEEALRQKVIQNAFSEEPELEPQPSAVEANALEDTEETEAIDPVTAIALEMMQEAGVMIEDDDPEVEMIDQSSRSKFLRSVEMAIEAKRQRLATSRPIAPTNLGGAGGPTSPLPEGLSPYEYFRMAFGGN